MHNRTRCADINKSYAYAADNFQFLDMAFLPTVLQESGQA